MVNDGAARRGTRRVQADPPAVRIILILLALACVALFVVVPLVHVFYTAFSRGPNVYWRTLVGDADTRSAILLTLGVAPVAVVLNVVFGVAAAWAIARFRFRGRALLLALIDLPFAVSPVVAGLMFVLLFGLQGYFGVWLRDHGMRIIFATPGLILATAFVTVPFIARELIPLMEALGAEEEIAAVSLGARGWQIFRRVTLPNIRWGLLYGVILCNARAMGEFGAVYVVSGHIAGRTETVPLRVEKLFQDYDTTGAFALASLLSALALVTLAVKTALEWRARSDNDRVPQPRGSAAASVPLPSARPAALAPTASVRQTPPGISLRDIRKCFGSFVALDDITLEVPEGALVALLGPSGSGKTTLLRVIAGLEAPDGGTIRYGHEDATQRAARERNIGFVFQHYALFRHMSVFENIAFGLRVRRWREDRIRHRVRELLRLVQLEGLESQAPAQLSGGQRQRVALARALAAQPQLLLLDEPFGALDAKVRQELRRWLRRLHDDIGITSVFVTHDQEEAFEVADRIVVMHRGRIEQEGTPEEVFEQPASAFVMDFLGNVNVFHGRVAGGRAWLGGLDMPYPEYPGHESKAATAYVRPHELEVDRLPRRTASLRAEIVRISAASATVKLELFAPDFGLPINVEITRERSSALRLAGGDTVFVFPKRVRVFVHDYQI